MQTGRVASVEDSGQPDASRSCANSEIGCPHSPDIRRCNHGSLEGNTAVQRGTTWRSQLVVAVVEGLFAGRQRVPGRCRIAPHFDRLCYCHLIDVYTIVKNTLNNMLLAVHILSNETFKQIEN